MTHNVAFIENYVGTWRAEDHVTPADVEEDAPYLEGERIEAALDHAYNIVVPSGRTWRFIPA